MTGYIRRPKTTDQETVSPRARPVVGAGADGSPQPSAPTHRNQTSMEMLAEDAALRGFPSVAAYRRWLRESGSGSATQSDGELAQRLSNLHVALGEKTDRLVRRDFRGSAGSRLRSVGGYFGVGERHDASPSVGNPAADTAGVRNDTVGAATDASDGSSSRRDAGGTGAEGFPQPSAPLDDTRVEYTRETLPRAPILIVVAAAGVWVGILGTVLFYGVAR